MFHLHHQRIILVDGGEGGFILSENELLNLGVINYTAVFLMLAIYFIAIFTRILNINML